MNCAGAALETAPKSPGVAASPVTQMSAERLDREDIGRADIGRADIGRADIGRAPSDR